MTNKIVLFLGAPYPTAPPQAGPYPGMHNQNFPPPSYDQAMGSHQPMYPPMNQNPGYGYQPQPGFAPQQPPPFVPQAQYHPYPPGPSHVPQGYPQPHPGQPQPPPSHFGLVAPVTAVFDSGARFNKNGPVTVPPPPPGYMPNQAQVAAMNGQSVHVQKGKNNFFTGGKGAGATFW